MPLILIFLLIIPGHGQGWRPLADQFEKIAEAKHSQFALHDDAGRSMDCLEVFQPAGQSTIYGIYHTLRKDVFSVHLARSRDLRKWSHVRTLDTHASQAAIHETENGAFLLALEKDAPNSCWIRLRHYPDLAHLRGEKHDREIDLPRTLAPTAEGTPSFESVEIPDEDLSRSTINLRHHYYRQAKVDQLASGTLLGFKTWKTNPSTRLNETFRKLGFSGNLGDRDRFEWRGKHYYLQEAQGKSHDWKSWRIFLCDHQGLPLKKLKFQTPLGATAFANPSVTPIRLPATGQDVLVFTAFIHGHGTHPSEKGSFLMVLP